MDTLKQSIADQSGFWSEFDGFCTAFWEASGPSRDSVFRAGALRGRQRGEKHVKNVVSEAPRLHVRVLFGTGPVPKGVLVLKTL